MYNKRVFNTADIGLSSNLVRETIEQLLNNQEEFDMTTRREFKFEKMNDGYYSRDNNIYNEAEAKFYALKEIRRNFANNAKMEDISIKETKKNLKIGVLFSFRTDDDLWLIKNLEELQALLAEKISFLKDKEYVFNFIGNKVKFVFRTNNINNGCFLDKMNKDQNVYTQLLYFLLFLEEGKIRIIS